MTVFRDGQRWRYDFRFKGARYHGPCLDPETSEPVRSKRDAERVEGLVREHVRRQAQTPLVLPGTYTLAMAVEAYGVEAKSLRSWGNVRAHLREILAHFGAATPISQIGREEIARWVAWQREQPLRIYAGGPRAPEKPGQGKRAETSKTRSASTIQRYLATLHAVLTRATKNVDPQSGRPHLDRVPVFPEIQTPQHTPTPWTPAQLRAVFTEAAEHVRDAMTLALLTGMRKGEVLRLTTDRVLLDLGVIRKGTNNKAMRDGLVPIPPAALPLVQRLVEQARARGTQHLITYRPRGAEGYAPVANIKRAFVAAQRRAGIDGRLRFHALKTTAITLAAQAGASAPTLQRIGDHADMRTTLRHYAGVSDADRVRAVQGIADGLVGAGILPALPAPETPAAAAPGAPEAKPRRGRRKAT